ncbi:restriction endonuclease subunit S [Delftia acidovorans]|uniref:restriction endonuclease subunit S n=1 Tax=Delftia acidovorans TaxID=80866 RepID=UPI001EDCD128|nr:restriction endonuclease subunit S [Delftia acidovorans]MCG3783646.1 restriction endonuclease subunit S [Delftia acidovorans]
MLLLNLNLLATAPGGVARLRELILTLAVQGKLVPQDSADEPAGVLLQKMRAEKDRLIAEGKIRREKPFAENKNAGDPFELPKGWALCRLGDLLLSIRSGGTPSKQNPGYWNGEIPWASVKDLRFGEPISETQDFITQAGLDAGSELAPAGSILICTRMGLGKIGEALIDIAINQDLKAVQLGKGIHKQYFINYFKTLTVVGSGMTVAGIKQDELLGFLVPLPPEAEQARIVARVEELMRLCDALEDKVQLETTQHAQLVNTLLGRLTVSTTSEELADNWQRVSQHFDLLLDRPEAIDALEQTLLQLAVRGLLVHQDASDEPASTLLARIRFEKDLLIAEGKIKRDKPLPPITEQEQPFELPVGWEWARLGEIMLISSGVALGRKTAIPSPVALPYLRVANVQRWHLNLSSMKEVVIDQSELERFQLLSGDLLITEGGDWDKVGRTAIWRDELKFCLHQNHVFKARGISPDWNSVWAELYLNSGDARVYFASSAKQTTNLASINMTQLKNCAFPVPPIAEQSRIVTRVTALRRLCADLRQRLKAAQATQSHLAQALVESSNTL